MFSPEARWETGWACGPVSAGVTGPVGLLK